jgi:hypothetical protein
MLIIENNPDGTIAQTNYWQSEYNTRGLAYLSRHNLGLRLLIPSAITATWLAEIKTGRRAVIEPPVRAGFSNHIDIVFDDGTANPFSLCIDKTAQLDGQLRSGNTRLLIYADKGLSSPLELPCEIKLPDAPKQAFLTHATVDTGHSKRSYRNEVSDGVIGEIKTWLPDLFAGKLRGVIDDYYAVRCDWHNSKSVGFTVSRMNAEMQATEIVKFCVCRHSKRAKPSWEFVGGKGNPPPVPFVAATFFPNNLNVDDLASISAIADFERCLAWAWMESHI